MVSRGKGTLIFLFLILTCYSSSLFCETVHRDVKLDYKQGDSFRSWFARIIHEQLRQGPSPRWTQRDCASLIRYGAYEALKTHDKKWLRANGLNNRNLPPDVKLREEQKSILNSWKQMGGEKTGPYVSAIVLIQENTAFISKDFNMALPGDIIFFDQGESQHVMVWMGNHIAYHTGTVKKNDNGLRRVSLTQLMNWRDTRWQPKIDNPNFIGIFRFSFLSH